jgi:hypothetical protein
MKIARSTFSSLQIDGREAARANFEELILLEPVLKWRDVESAVYDYVRANNINLTLDQFRYPRGGKTGRKYIGPSWGKLARLDPRWTPSTTSDPMAYDCSLWRGVRAWEYFCYYIRLRSDEGKSCEEICDKWLAGKPV